MAEFLTTTGTSFHIENIILRAKRKLILVSPYLQISKTFFERLKDANNRGVKIKILYGKNDLKYNEKEMLAALDKLEIYYFDNLHAKCYFNESEMVITSMNMYEFSEKNNREMGVFITRAKDQELFDNAVNETLSIMHSSEKEDLLKAQRENNSQNSNKDHWAIGIDNTYGFCIRCGDQIEFNPDKPYCWNCYDVWRQYENEDFLERFCHKCGDPESSSMAKPQCYECFKEFVSI